MPVRQWVPGPYSPIPSPGQSPGTPAQRPPGLGAAPRRGRRDLCEAQPQIPDASALPHAMPLLPLAHASLPFTGLSGEAVTDSDAPSPLGPPRPPSLRVSCRATQHHDDSESPAEGAAWSTVTGSRSLSSRCRFWSQATRLPAPEGVPGGGPGSAGQLGMRWRGLVYRSGTPGKPCQPEWNSSQSPSAGARPRRVPASCGIG